MFENAVMGVRYHQEGTEHEALWAPIANHSMEEVVLQV